MKSEVREVLRAFFVSYFTTIVSTRYSLEIYC